MSTFYWIHGLPGAGKTTTGKLLHKYMIEKELKVILLDGDEIRDLFESYDYTVCGRDKMMEKTLRLVSMLLSQENDVILCNCAMENKYRKMCEECSPNLKEIYLDVSIEELIRRDQKQLYSKALNGEIENVRGINMAYDVPENPELVVKNDSELSAGQVVDIIIKSFCI